MSLSLYKPNSKNTGCGFSFQAGLDKKNNQTTLYAKAIKQHSWDSGKKQGYFAQNSKNPEKNIIIKFNEFECGEIIHAIKNRKEYSTFHSFGEDKTVIKLSPWDKKAKKSFKNSDSGQWEEKWITVDAFSISFTRNGNQLFGIGLEPGESQCLLEFMRFILQKIFSERNAVEMQKMKNQDYSKNESSADAESAPF
jgi:hypothetical protein